MKTKIYLLHGWAYETGKWGKFLNLLNEKDFDPILLNVPGLTKPINKAWNIDDYVNWLDKELKEDKAALLGHSYGGRICLEYTLRFPKKVSHLILLDSAGVYHNELPIRLKRSLFNVLAKTGKQFTDSEILRHALYKIAREKDYDEANSNMKQTMVNMLSSDKERIIDSIETKTTIIWGENDAITPISDAHYFESHLKNSTLHIVDGARHSPHFTHVEDVVEIIKSEILNHKY
jgi:pimeloyl-[acyl-carrier protein] methyl ester esterase